jgi:hypothetical protein
MEKGSAASFLDLVLREDFNSVLNEPLPAKLAELVGQLRAREETQKRADQAANPQHSADRSKRRCEWFQPLKMRIITSWTARSSLGESLVQDANSRVIAAATIFALTHGSTI